MIKTLIGPQLFRKGMDLYFERHDGEAATIEQFVQCFADASGRDFKQFMRWYSQAGTPEIAATGRYDATRQDLSARPRANDAADAGPADQRADGGAARHRPRRQGRRPAAQARRRAGAGARRAGARQAGAELHLHRRCRAAGALDQPRLLGADQARRQAHLRRSARARRARQRSVQPLAGGADARHQPAHRQRGAAARRTGSGDRRRPARARWPRSSPTARSSLPSSPRRCRCRAKPTSRARSARTSIPTRSSAPAPACAR